MLVSNELAAEAKQRSDINENDSVETVWTDFTELKYLLVVSIVVVNLDK